MVLPSARRRSSLAQAGFIDSQWLKHQFPYYSIQSLDTVQMPRMPADIDAYEKALTRTNQANAFPPDPRLAAHQHALPAGRGGVQ